MTEKLKCTKSKDFCTRHDKSDRFDMKIIDSNPHLRDPVRRANLIKRSVRTSCGVEGMSKKQELKIIDCEANGAWVDFSDSLEKIGFAVLKNHGVLPHIIEKAYEDWGRFFKTDAKFNYNREEGSQAGYFSTQVSETAKGANEKDLKEFFQYYYNGVAPYDIEQNTRKTYIQLYKLACKLLEWAEWGLPFGIRKGLSEPLTDMILNSEETILRFIHYPPIEGEIKPGQVRAAAHEDINLLTILPAATAEGLEVKDSDGNWFKVPTGKDLIVVNTGDMLAEATLKWYPATTHRVVNPNDSTEARLSMPLFLHPRPDVQLSKKYTAGEYLDERLKELGLKNE